MEKLYSETSSNLSNEIYSKLHMKISRHALVLLKKQYLLNLDRSKIEGWTEYYARVYGLPCEHVLYSNIETEQPFQARAFSNQRALYHKKARTASTPRFLAYCHPSISWRCKLRKVAPESGKVSTVGLWAISGNKCSTVVKQVTTGVGAPLLALLNPWNTAKIFDIEHVLHADAKTPLT